MPTCEFATVKIDDRGKEFSRETANVKFTFHNEDAKIITGVEILDDGFKGRPPQEGGKGQDFNLKLFGSCDAGFGQVVAGGSQDARLFLITKSVFKGSDECCDAKQLVFARQLTELSVSELLLFFGRITRLVAKKKDRKDCKDGDFPFTLASPALTQRKAPKKATAKKTTKKKRPAAKTAKGARRATRA